MGLVGQHGDAANRLKAELGTAMLALALVQLTLALVQLTLALWWYLAGARLP